jgi:small-conductance mechanosensitive channel
VTLLDTILEALRGQTLRAALITVLGFPAIYGLSRWLRRAITQKYDAQSGLVAGKLTFYPLVLLLLVSVLRELGFSLAPLLGAAGILGIALGFASQTSVSNVISGFFLIGERPFEVDDVIEVGGTVGVVLSVDMLSVKLRTFDNRFVRIPNETIIKSQVITNTRFPIRRVDMNVSVAYGEDVARVREILREVADANPRSMMDPEPVVVHEGFGESGVDLRLSVWTLTGQFLEVRTALREEIKRRFDEEGIEIPFPHVSLYAGAHTEPLRVSVIRPDSNG